ncbi:MAG: putative Zn-dependent protease [Alphaproteobacteria bacterium]|jgi:predicted Zn-dependent protease
MKFAAKKCVTIIATALLLNACATSPTGRSQVLLFPDSELASMGQQAFAGMKSDIKISNMPVENRLVQCIAEALLQHADNSVYGGEWEVVVFDDEQVNAFALPGGKIGVYTGLLKVAVNQHQIAAVVGHEIGHVIAKHGNERMSNNALIGMGQQAAGQILAASEVAQTPEIMMALGVGLKFGSLKYSRVHESEADEIGLTLMAKAGFKPSESVSLWRNMAAQSGGNRQPEFMSTHPAPDTRIENLTRQLPQAEKLYNAMRSRPNCNT